ncbi:winged helix-turn-helix transcriptional regulator [Arthrobacter sp. ISL-48]|uniref:winged helix-turn-helix domain-containing protein n=1 Tax=Arthrobacter sp. ISL-48 TaxID=2819110 RepID=UPI001BE87073|nr:winged helix-turn-helix domain-containing protein [Arthrobacter sp. ISL-48]MBT2534196.1 winged helix-turn-helix transcriptional regulator [Arthrobacter sp. ISL-48]
MTTDFELKKPLAVHRPGRSEKGRSTPIRTEIIDYLARNGASKVADISNGVGSSRDCVRYHLAALETASIVRSDTSPGARGGFTPFYALAPEKRPGWKV